MLLIALAAAGCAQEPPDPGVKAQQAIAEWLHEGPRTIAVGAKRDTLEVRYWTEESAALSGAGEGAGKGALAMLYGGVLTGDPYGLILGILLMPVGAIGGAVIGAATAEPEIVRTGVLTDVAEANPLSEVFAKRYLGMAVRDQVIRRARDDTRHLVFAAPPAHARPGHPPAARLDIAVVRLGLAGNDADDPRAVLTMTVDAAFRGPASTRYERFEYDGSRRRLSDWTENGAVLFREALDDAIDDIARRVVAEMLESDPQRKRSDGLD